MSLITDRLAEAYMAARSRWVLQLSGEEKRTRRKLKKVRTFHVIGCSSEVPLALFPIRLKNEREPEITGLDVVVRL